MSDKKSSAGLVLVAWAVVCIPLGWGVYKTAVNAMKLFAAPPAATAPATTQPPAK
jgi:hypothetical protein